LNKSTRALTALSFMIEAPDGSIQVAIQNVRKDRRLGASLAQVTIDRVTGVATSGSVSTALSVIRGGALGHYQQPQIPDLLNKALSDEGLLPLDNPIRDFSEIVHEHLSGRFGEDPPTLSVLARRHGLPECDIDRTQEDSSAGLALMARLYKDIWARLSGFSGVIQQVSEPGFVSSRDCFATPTRPLKAPDLPNISPPPGGWRTTPWAPDEQHAVARDFCHGEPLEAMSRTYRRSPRAIISRLMLDGIAQK